MCLLLPKTIHASIFWFPYSWARPAAKLLTLTTLIQTTARMCGVDGCVCKTKLGRWVELAGGSADPAAAPMVWNSNWMWNGESEKDSFALLYNIAQTQLCGALPQPRQQWEASKSGKLCGAGCIRINVSSDVSRNAMYTQSSHTCCEALLFQKFYTWSRLPPTPENLNHPCQYTSLDTWLIVFETLFQHAAAAPSAAAAPLPSAARDDVLQPFMLVLPGLSSLLIAAPCQPRHTTPHHSTFQTFLNECYKNLNNWYCVKWTRE